MKRGISLIVLVITIIVMIILAASVVISLTSTGVIDRANSAVDLTDEKQVQNLAAMVWSDAYLNGKRGSELKTVVETELGKQGVTSTDWFMDITETGIVVVDKYGLYEFQISGINYYFEPGMTWEQWANSIYNTDGFKIVRGIVRTADESGYISENGTDGVSGTITSGITYMIVDSDEDPPENSVIT